MIGAAFSDTGESIVWVDAPLTIDQTDASYDYAYDTGITEFWRIDLGDTYLIGSIECRLAYETAGSNALILQGANEADYSDAVTVATIPVTATGIFTAQDISRQLDADRGVPLLATRPDHRGRHQHPRGRAVRRRDGQRRRVSVHDDLTGRDAADQHPADSVEYDTTGSGLTATEVQAAIDEVVLTVDDGTTSVSPVNSIVFDGATVTDDTGGQVTVEITGGSGSSGPSLELDYVQITAGQHDRDDRGRGQHRRHRERDDVRRRRRRCGRGMVAVRDGPTTLVRTSSFVVVRRLQFHRADRHGHVAMPAWSSTTTRP